jgi:hypothetical protein
VRSAYMIDKANSADKADLVAEAEKGRVDHYSVMAVRKNKMVMWDEEVLVQMPRAEMQATIVEWVTKDHMSALTPSIYDRRARTKERPRMDWLRMARSYDKASAACKNLSRKPKNRGKRDDNSAN